MRDFSVGKFAQVEQFHRRAISGLNLVERVDHCFRIQDAQCIGRNRGSIVDFRSEFHVWMTRLNSERTKKLPAERSEQPAFHLGSVANLMRSLSKNEKRLLSQIAGFRLVLGQGEREPVKGRIKPSDNRFEVLLGSKNFFTLHRTYSFVH